MAESVRVRRCDGLCSEGRLELAEMVTLAMFAVFAFCVASFCSV